MNQKIKTIEELKNIIDNLKKDGKKIVHCHGCFDFFHYGHLEHFRDAKTQGDVLIVSITPDEFIQKGPDRPYFNQNIRTEFISELECVDYVTINKFDTAVEILNMFKPDVYAKGKESLQNKDIDKKNNENGEISNLEIEKRIVESYGGRLYLTDTITFSSSRIINKIFEAIPEESKEFIRKIKAKYGIDEIIAKISSLKDIRPLIIGDAILDEYVYCEVMDKTGKEGIVANKYLSSELQLGGVFAVANNVAEFTEHPTLITCVGKNHIDFINKKLNKNIEPFLIVQEDSKTIVKRRYLNNYSGRKDFEIYNANKLDISDESEKKIIDYINKNIHNFDLIIIPDYGHGIISKRLIDFLSNCRKFLAINCQLNGGNMGYNFITKYPKGDFISLNDKELRLPFQKREGDIKEAILQLSEKLHTDKINITLGKRGCIYYERGDFYYHPPFTKEPLDTVGSGDAVLSLTSLLTYKGIEPDLVPFLGNVIGAISTRIMGNQRSIDPTEVKKFVSYISR